MTKEEQYKEELKEIPEPDNMEIKIKKIEDIVMPHPYCITPKHLKYSESMYLDIEAAEKKGAVCDICKSASRKAPYPKILKYEEHIAQKTLFIRVPQNHDLNKVEGLNEYLNKIKPTLERLKIDGVAFPTR